MREPLRALVLFAASSANRNLAYQHGWPRHLAVDRRFDTTLVNLAGRGATLRLAAALRRGPYDAVVSLHSVFSNECHLRGALLERVRRLPALKVVFLGNEYKLMPEKVAFCEALDVGLLVSQLLAVEARELYRARLGCEVVLLPSGGLDVELFRPTTEPDSRPIDIGYRAYPNPWYLGHREREELAEAIDHAGRTTGLRTDVSLDPADRFDERGWAAFLNRCTAQAGSAAGGDRFELDDATRLAVNAFVAARPDASFADVRERFFSRSTPHPSGRALSGRIIEAAGTRTAQLLLEDDYGGYFEPDVHYIPLRKDFSNVEEAIAKLRDVAYRVAIVDAAHDVALAELTYERLIGRLHDAVERLLR